MGHSQLPVGRNCQLCLCFLNPFNGNKIIFSSAQNTFFFISNPFRFLFFFLSPILLLLFFPPSLFISPPLSLFLGCPLKYTYILHTSPFSLPVGQSGIYYQEDPFFFKQDVKWVIKSFINSHHQKREEERETFSFKLLFLTFIRS